jgi:hypothetical protein
MFVRKTTSPQGLNSVDFERLDMGLRTPLFFCNNQVNVVKGDTLFLMDDSNSYLVARSRTQNSGSRVRSG